jgi:Wiskott-Aldrich syndrome protein
VPHARISLVIAKEPLGNFKAIVLRTDYDARVALLSETAPSLDDALQALHVRSAEAVQNYIGTNGFAFRSSKRRSRDIGYDSDSASSSVTLDDCESLSDNETVSVTSVGRAKRSSRRKADKAAKRSAGKHKARHGRSRSRSPSFSTTRARSHSTCSSSSSELEPNYDPTTMPPGRAPLLLRARHTVKAAGLPPGESQGDVLDVPGREVRGLEDGAAGAVGGPGYVED